jgi:hypothetical protein
MGYLDVSQGTIMNLTDRGLFVSISGNVHAVIWPNHYADIRLKHPERKFKVGKSIKCRVCPQLSCFLARDTCADNIGPTPGPCG